MFALAVTWAFLFSLSLFFPVLTVYPIQYTYLKITQVCFSFSFYYKYSCHDSLNSFFFWRCKMYINISRGEGLAGKDNIKEFCWLPVSYMSHPETQYRIKIVLLWNYFPWVNMIASSCIFTSLQLKWRFSKLV